MSEYTKTYTSFSGADIVATFDGVVIGELQAITYSVTREKVPIYTMGSKDPRSFSRGKRGIAGSLVFQVFDRDCLKTLRDKYTIETARANIGIGPYNPQSMDEWDRKEATTGTAVNDFFGSAAVTYSDEIPPFDITITFANEYGQKAKMAIYGVEILNEGMGLSIDDITTAKACTFVARSIDPLVNM